MADLSETLEQIALEALSLAERAERFPKVIDGLLSAPQSFVEITVRDDGRSASGALKLGLGAKASDRADILLTALRAGNANLGIIEHLLSSSVGGDTSTVAARRCCSTAAPSAPAGVALPLRPRRSTPSS